MYSMPASTSSTVGTSKATWLSEAWGALAMATLWWSRLHFRKTMCSVSSATRKPSTSIRNRTYASALGEFRTTWLTFAGRIGGSPGIAADSPAGATSAESSISRPSGSAMRRP